MKINETHSTENTLNTDAEIFTSNNTEEVFEQKSLEPPTNEELINKWRNTYGKLYLSVYDEMEFLWRKIRRREYTEIMDNTNEEEINDVIEYRQLLVIKACVLSPDEETVLEKYIEEYPGLLTSLSGEILKKSGFSKPLTIEI